MSRSAIENRRTMQELGLGKLAVTLPK
jgi:hypothetical protein